MRAEIGSGRNLSKMCQIIGQLAAIVTIIMSITCGSSANQERANFFTFEDSPTVKHFSSLPEPMMLTSDQFANNSQPPEPAISPSSYYANAQAQRFRVNVSNLCEKNQMRVTIRLNKPFYGLIHTKDKRKKPGCFVEGNGDQSFPLDISFTQVQSDANYCGVVAHQVSNQNQQHRMQNYSANQQTLSVILVVRLHKTIEFSDDRYFLLSCANRCSRSDCSTLNSSTQDSGSRTVNPGFKGFATSESIVSPIIKSRDEIATIGQSNKLLHDDSLVVVHGSERCDYTMDLRFQWLVKLCWVLSSLLLIVLCLAFYLCLTLNKKRIEKNKIKRQKERSAASRQEEDAPMRNQFFQGAHLNTTSDGYRGVPMQVNLKTDPNMEAHNIENFRANNTFLGKQQHQQFSGLDLVTAQQIGSQTHSQVIGRSIETSLGISRLTSGQHLDGKVKRRRSIGSSTMQLISDEYNHSQQLQYLQNNQQSIDRRNIEKLHSSQRAKSRSQTTIHYEQSQDPFKTVPFNYINNGYLSDAASTQTQAVQSGPEDIGNSFSAQSLVPVQPSIEHQYDYQFKSTSSQPIPTGLPAKYADFEECRRQWPRAKLNYALTGAQVNQDCNNNNDFHSQSNSQFDPSNSLRLADLIQQKHRQQLAQASLTASTIQSQYMQRHPPQPPLRPTNPRAWK